MAIKIGICGTGLLARNFIPLFKAHPGVEEVVLADLISERLEAMAAQYGVNRTYPSLDALCEADVDAIAIFTQRHLHGPQSLQVLESGKHVYCSVPIAQSLAEIGQIVDAVARTKLIYMTGETSYYYPCTIYCRERFRAGDFGHVFYSEAQYLHDMSHGFYDAFKHSGGEDWKKVAGFPPMYYPTHSVSMVLSVTGARATHVSCLGYEDRHADGIFKRGANLWDNVFSNETALMRTSDGGMCRINEFRRVGWRGMSSVHLSVFGTDGCYEEQANRRVWVGHTKEEETDLTEYLTCKERPSLDMTDWWPGTPQEPAAYRGVAQVHSIDRLPRTFAGLNNGHQGSHQFLVDDFVKAVVHNRLPPNHVWDAAKYCAPGLVAHESALKGGTQLPVPDFGAPPGEWRPLDPSIEVG